MGLISLWGSWSTRSGWRRRPATWRIRGTVDGQIVEKEEPSTHPGIVTRPRPHLSDDQTFREAPIVLPSNGILLRAPQAEWLMGSQGRVNHCYRLFVFLIDFNIHIRTRKRLEVVLGMWLHCACSTQGADAGMYDAFSEIHKFSTVIQDNSWILRVSNFWWWLHPVTIQFKFY